MQIVFISSIRWDFSWHRQQEVMSKLAEKGAQVLFVQPCDKRRPFYRELKRKTENIWIFTPRGLPYERCLYSVNAINSIISRNEIKKVMLTIGFQDPIIWMDRVHGFDFKYFGRYCTVYDLVDEILAFGRMKNSKMLINIENAVLKNVDILFSSSQTLLSRKIRQSERQGEAWFIPNGVSVDRFIVQKNKQKNGIIGFIGDISKRRINYEWIHKAAEMHPEWKFVFIGPGSERDRHELKGRIKNITCSGPVTGEKIPDIIADFDVGIIPYNCEKNDMNYIFPRKACEYLACGKPVVSVALPEIQYLQPMVKVAYNFNDFCKAIQEALKDDRVEERRKFAEQFEWDILIDNIIEKLVSKSKK